jgi:hypothetical protein
LLLFLELLVIHATTTITITITTMSSSENDARAESSSSETATSTSVSCTKYFDALWFCYSPVHQLKRYYVHGDVDDCVGHWGTLMACLKQKTRFRMDEDAALPPQPCMWTIRSPEEARTFWAEEFGGESRDEAMREERGEGVPPMT